MAESYNYIDDIKTGQNVFIAPGARLIGDVTLKDGANIWYNAVLRADVASITIGVNTNIQDNATVHVDYDTCCVLGDRVTVGHGAVLHACNIGDDCLIGMNAVVLSGAKIGKNCIVAAGSVVPEKMEIPDNSMVAGVPAKIKKTVDEAAMEAIRFNNGEYLKLAARARQIEEEKRK